ncbi:glycosyltransferase family 2 protein [Tautonia plasticadhaerens]|uniref:Teichuronic acid biosynthesis glycosyltransferase TuaG n=1 Tax=Tautonia plasticadhaerens TaxID=2527974 RepID=A0A518H618_9BACT|nr:glycosyltransferase [Tautonia plasticadhaerens]QDV36258.1 Putative teichuronic acid biosynthesis glycosyltransferase TuaG [Tautonia plasticadhaerens]
MSPARDPSAVPPIEPVSEGLDRPFWSVMMPAYNAGDYLEQSLRSVLDQDPGPHRMQIAVVDDASAGVDRAEAIVRRLAPARVEFHRAAENLGLAGNWNRCIGLARGHWVHLLHQDDWILPGFYEQLGRAEAEAPGVGAAFCRQFFADRDGHWTALSHLEGRAAGVLESLLVRLSSFQPIQCPSIVVRRSTYEALGGFQGDLRYNLDWEMWCRIASRYPVWYEPSPLACYRQHEGSETAALMEAGAVVPDIRRAISIVRPYMPTELHPSIGLGKLDWVRHVMLREADRALTRGDYRSGLRHLRQAVACDPSGRWRHDIWSRRRWALKLIVRQSLGLDRPRAAPGP